MQRYTSRLRMGFIHSYTASFYVSVWFENTISSIGTLRVRGMGRVSQIASTEVKYCLLPLRVWQIVTPFLVSGCFEVLLVHRSRAAWFTAVGKRVRSWSQKARNFSACASYSSARYYTSELRVLVRVQCRTPSTRRSHYSVPGTGYQVQYLYLYLVCMYALYAYVPPFRKDCRNRILATSTIKYHAYSSMLS